MISTILLNTEKLLADSGAEKKPADQYSHIRYPKLLPLMDFRITQYDLPGLGSCMMMHTTTKMGMELLTVSLMPGTGRQVPYFLMDCMSMKNKRCVFAEFYGCGNADLSHGDLDSVYERYNALPDYAEKPGWYISEREPYSLIKAGAESDLVNMAKDCIGAYLLCARSASVSGDYISQLIAFRQRMIDEGNPSSKTLNMLFKKDGAVTFMKDVVMPICD